jgi:hypothetical protein
MQQLIAPTNPKPSFKRNPAPMLEGNCFLRLLTAKTIGRVCGESPRTIAGQMWPNDRAVMELIERAASNPAMTSVAGWAAELAQKRVVDTLDAMGAASGAADVMKAGLVLDWDGAGTISAPGFVASGANSGFVQEGQPIPVRQLAAAAAQLTPAKLASIAVLTREMIQSSNAEKLIGDALVASSGLALDNVFFGALAATAAQPAGIRYNIAALPPSASTDAFGAVFEDTLTLINAVSVVGGKGPYLIIGSPGRIMSYAMRTGSERTIETGLISIMSNAMGADVMAIAPNALIAALSADADVETASSATLVMDTAPVAPDTTLATKAMWQTDSIAIKVRWPVTWSLRDPRGVAWLTPAWK